jgi:hypothetical protein
MSSIFRSSSTNPTRLSSRYEIRQLTLSQLDFAAAIVCHSNMFHSPLWPVLYPENKTQHLHELFRAATYLVSHQINSMMSFGVFDTEYKYKRPESAAAEGKLYWDEKEVDADNTTLLEQMDFPLCSVALAYDESNPLDMSSMEPLVESLPLFATIHQVLEGLDSRYPETWKAKAPGEVLMRNATSTRADYEREGLMKKLAQWLMRHAAANGYRGIQIQCIHDAVTHTWLHPPKPFCAELVCQFDTASYKTENEQ